MACNLYFTSLWVLLVMNTSFSMSLHIETVQYLNLSFSADSLWSAFEKLNSL